MILFNSDNLLADEQNIKLVLGQVYDFARGYDNKQDRVKTNDDPTEIGIEYNYFINDKFSFGFSYGQIESEYALVEKDPVEVELGTFKTRYKPIQVKFNYWFSENKHGKFSGFFKYGSGALTFDKSELKSSNASIVTFGVEYDYSLRDNIILSGEVGLRKVTTQRITYKAIDINGDEITSKYRLPFFSIGIGYSF